MENKFTKAKTPIKTLYQKFLSLLFGAALIACASTASSRAEKQALSDFSGRWSVKWCDKSVPNSDECGGFAVTLKQKKDVIEGTYDAVDSKFMQSDENGEVHGIVLGKDAVLTVESARSGAIYLVKIATDKSRMIWKLRDTVRKSDNDIDLVAHDVILTKLIRY